MSQEIWKDIPWYEWFYKASNLWNILSLNYRWKKWKKQILLWWLTTPWYKMIILCNGKQKKFDIHRIIASLFLENPEKKSQVNHKNGIKTDNRVDNLEWCTPSHNSLHSQYSLWHESGILKKKVLMFDMLWNFINEFNSVSMAARQMNLEQWNISSACIWKYKQCWWFIWKYL